MRHQEQHADRHTGTPSRRRLTALVARRMNVGLMLMVLLSVLSVGILQTWVSVEVGTWWARSA